MAWSWTHNLIFTHIGSTAFIPLSCRRGQDLPRKNSRRWREQNIATIYLCWILLSCSFLRFWKRIRAWNLVVFVELLMLKNAEPLPKNCCATMGWQYFLKFIYSEKATNLCKISAVDLSYVITVKSTVEILQNFVAFSEYMNFTWTKASNPPSGLSMFPEIGAFATFCWNSRASGDSDIWCWKL